MNHLRSGCIPVFLLLFGACQAPPGDQDIAALASAPARLYDGYGAYHRAVTCTVPEAQRWFDQGLQLVYGFNHDEAIRSFREAALLDPGCGMAWWGIAYACGIDVNNNEVSETEARAGAAAAQKALTLLDQVTPVEQALIRAVAKRAVWPVPKERKAIDEAYASAMGEAWRAFPSDADLGTLYAEAMMNLQAWDYWTAAGEPKGRALEIVATLEQVMAQAPRHPGANHFYIHAVEASKDPARGLVAADRLCALVPGSGHLVHMPSHIYINTGRYADAVAANQRAIKADEAYFRVAPPPDFYSLYFVHNIHFLAYAAMMEGRYAIALAATRKMEKEVPDAFLRQWTALADGLMPATLHVMVRFGRWDDILAEPEYPEFRKASRALRHYARAVALANLKRTEEARAELAAYDVAAAEVPEDWLIGTNKAHAILGLARLMAEGEILWREDKGDDAYRVLRKAVATQDQLVYDEPPGWMMPIRHALGALLLAGGRAEEAREVYRVDLEHNRDNAWALLGLAQALRRLGRNDEADQIQPRVTEAWARADVDPPASCYCGERPR